MTHDGDDERVTYDNDDGQMMPRVPGCCKLLTVPLRMVRATDGVLMVPIFQMFACNNSRITSQYCLLLQVNWVTNRCNEVHTWFE